MTPRLPPLPPGRVLPVLTAPDHGLTRPAEAVDPAAPETVQLAADLLATQRAAASCVGVAAPQLGLPARVFSLDVTGHPKARACHGALVLCNPVLVAASRRERGREGCLSVPDLTVDVRRATRLDLVAQLPGTGEQVRLRTDAFEARAIQHELDHLDGLLILDRAAGAHCVHPRQVYRH